MLSLTTLHRQSIGQAVLHGTLYNAALISTVKTSWRQSMGRVGKYENLSDLGYFRSKITKVAMFLQNLKNDIAEG